MGFRVPPGGMSGCEKIDRLTTEAQRGLAAATKTQISNFKQASREKPKPQIPNKTESTPSVSL